MTTNLNEEVQSVSERLLEYENKATLIFFAVYGYFKFTKREAEPRLRKKPLENEVKDMKIRFKQEFVIEINGEEYPILENAEKTLFNIFK